MMKAILVASTLLISSKMVSAQTFTADFGRASGPPLSKTKFAVYQTPLGSEEKILQSMELLSEAGARDLRYETAWGKPDAVAFDQIHGTAQAPIIDFAPLDRLVKALDRHDVSLLLDMTYNPLPLKKDATWPSWKDAPNDLAAWQRITGHYAAHFQNRARNRVAYEIWNEPDLPGDGGKVFFNGNAADYGALYRPAATGIRQSDRDANIGGPGIAFDLGYVRAILNPPDAAQPLDFISIHAYENYAAQLKGLRGLLNNRPGLPIYLTEYASYSSFGLSAPISRHAGAMRFFRDAKGLLDFCDTPKVFWAQWADNDLGMLTGDGHRKAVFNAYKIYQTLLPTDRNTVAPDAAEGLNTLAASESQRAAIVLWNETALEKTATINLRNLPFARGKLRLYRIDADHASFVDNPNAENLTIEKEWDFSDSKASWSGVIAGESVVFLQAVASADPPKSSAKHDSDADSIGDYVRSLGWYFNRDSQCYAEFDARTSIARVGLDRDFGVAQTGIIVDKAVPRLRVQIQKSGPFAPQDLNGLFALRLDYGLAGGGFGSSALFHDGSWQRGRTAVLPWGKGGASGDVQIEQRAMKSGGAWNIEVARRAPRGWNGRLILTPILQNMGKASQARFHFTPLIARPSTLKRH